MKVPGDLKLLKKLFRVDIQLGKFKLPRTCIRRNKQPDYYYYFALLDYILPTLFNMSKIVELITRVKKAFTHCAKRNINKIIFFV